MAAGITVHGRSQIAGMSFTAPDVFRVSTHPFLTKQPAPCVAPTPQGRYGVSAQDQSVATASH